MLKELADFQWVKISRRAYGDTENFSFSFEGQRKGK
jgi:hypothetical protein